MKKFLSIAGVAAATVALTLTAASPATAATTPKTSTSVNTTCNVTTDKVLVAVYAENTESVPVSVKFVTDYGTKSATVAAGARYYQTLETSKGNVASGKVAVSVYRGATATEAAAYSYTEKAFPEKTCTQNPIGTANGGSYINSSTGKIALTGYFTNKGKDAVSVRLLTPKGESAAQTVEPGKSAYLVVQTTDATTTDLAGSIRAYKYIDGKGLSSLFPVTFPGRTSVVPTTISVSSGFAKGLSDTRATGHKELKGTGLRIWTEGATSTDKVAEYVFTNTALSAVGTPALDYTPTTGGKPGYQLVVDFDGDGQSDGILVGEDVYGQNWWLSNSATAPVKAAAPHTGGGFGSQWYGTLAEWSAAFPNAKVAAYGFSLGSGVLGDGVLNSITFAGKAYTFVQ
ncbi:hypothetical protein [Herbiconiux sp. L3-i23]|uniref:hypothetical protein n=1 Tax=Herbiconiux sp. L3-i23 TaxID=2905871 RepID=UPI00206125B6|nr:hypothetical protein [Herbiconiux sp. L3-i23]BDI23961.1 hypothetical protein L3i23_27370 [Herbiconiux sp. L3-i23]